MENCLEKLEDFNNNFKKHVKPKQDQIISYNSENLIGKENKKDFICPVCLEVLKNPISCSGNKNSHSFCKDCIDKYLKQNNKCPSCKLIFEYKINNDIYNELNKLFFQCEFKNEGCNAIISYSEYLNHINNCKYSNIMICECNIKKYNYGLKEFKNCGYIGQCKIILNYVDILNINVLFCNEDILLMNLEEHVKNKCKFGIIKYSNGDKYIGKKYNNMKEGYGIFYCSNRDRYEG